MLTLQAVVVNKSGNVVTHQMNLSKGSKLQFAIAVKSFATWAIQRELTFF